MGTRKKTFQNIAAPEHLWGNTIDNLGDVNTHHRDFSIDLLRLFLAARVPLILHGPPGAGKSATINALSQLTDEDGIHYNVVSIIPSTTDPTVLNGMMYTSVNHTTGETIMQRSLPDHAVEINRKYEEDNQLTVLMLDEMSTAMISQQHSLLNFLTTGQWGDLDISDKISIVMASNPKGTVRVSRDLDKQFLNRAGHIPWYSDKDKFMEGWKTGFNRPGLEPSPQAYREIAQLMDQDPQHVFRSHDFDDRGRETGWKVNNLVPYADLTMSERTVELYGKLSELIDNVSGVNKSVNPDIRWVYKQHVAEALFGTYWGDKMKSVINQERRRAVDGPAVVQASTTLSWDSDYNSVASAVGTLWHSGSGVSSGEGRKIFDDLVSSVKRGKERGTLSLEDVLAVWAFASTAPGGEADFNSFAPELLVMLQTGKQLYNEGVVPSASAPEFVPDALRGAVRSLVQV